MGKQTRRRLCVKGKQLSNDCKESKSERFEEKTCYVKPCPMTDPKNCCQAISLMSDLPSPFTGIYFITDASSGIKYRHADHDFFIEKGKFKRVILLMEVNKC